MKNSILLILIVPILSNCSLIGLGSGALLDSGNRKKDDRIQSENQKITVVYNDGKRYKARYHSIIYYARPNYSGLSNTGSSKPSIKEYKFPTIGERVEIEFNNSSATGNYAGIHKQEDQLDFLISQLDSTESQSIPFKSIENIRFGNGDQLLDIPEPDEIMLLYEMDDQIYRAHLRILTHINHRPTSNALLLGTLGLLVDIAVFISAQNLDIEGGVGF